MALHRSLAASTPGTRKDHGKAHQSRSGGWPICQSLIANMRFSFLAFEQFDSVLTPHPCGTCIPDVFTKPCESSLYFATTVKRVVIGACYNGSLSAKGLKIISARTSAVLQPPRQLEIQHFYFYVEYVLFRWLSRSSLFLQSCLRLQTVRAWAAVRASAVTQFSNTRGFACS